MRRWLVLSLTLVALAVLGVSSAQAVVVPVGQSGRAGVAMVPGTIPSLKAAGINPVASTAACTDPALPPDLGVNQVLPSSHLPFGTTGLCWHAGGSVLHANETFAVTWDAQRFYWAGTRDFVEHFLRNVADASASLATPYAVVSQYTDATGRAGHKSLYGGGCIDYGDPGGATCRFANAVTSTAGQPFPTTGGCQASGALVCLTDDQIQHEVMTMIGEMGFIGRTQTGYQPLVVLLLPEGVDACLKSGTLCSVGTGTKAQFCSYHSFVTMTDGRRVPYVVQPWTPDTACDEPDVPKLSDAPTAEELAMDHGMRLVSPLSAGQIAAIVNPWLDAWYANDGSEINDNVACRPYAKIDGTTLAGGSYYLQREFNNAASIETDPYAQVCEGLVNLAPAFVPPSPIDAGDVVAFDGSITNSTLMVPKAGYLWNFGDGTGAVGPSVVHAFAKGGVYTVQLTVTDRGGNVATTTQQVTVTGSGGTSPPPNTKTKLHASIALIPQSYKSLLRSGIALRVTSSEPADGFSTILISRSAARRAHLRTGRSANVVVARGTVSGIKNGTVRLHLRLAPSVTTKLARLGHLKLTIKLSLIGASGARATIDAAGSY